MPEKVVSTVCKRLGQECVRPYKKPKYLWQEWPYGMTCHLREEESRRGNQLSTVSTGLCGKARDRFVLGGQRNKETRESLAQGISSPQLGGMGAKIRHLEVQSRNGNNEQ